MPIFKTIEEAERYGLKNFFEPEISATRNGNWKVFDRWDLRKQNH